MSAVMRWPGRPTSGRYVYRSRESRTWYWQCDLHDDPETDEPWGDAVSMPDALAAACAHACGCPFTNMRAVHA